MKKLLGAVVAALFVVALSVDVGAIKSQTPKLPVTPEEFAAIAKKAKPVVRKKKTPQKIIRKINPAKYAKSMHKKTK
ncbi:hypothetical protein HOD08_04285 [bacterium]|nr:hypothetical protein [bacterium]